jgi:hypothetical protein
MQPLKIPGKLQPAHVCHCHPAKSNAHPVLLQLQEEHEPGLHAQKTWHNLYLPLMFYKIVHHSTIEVQRINDDDGRI